MSRGYGDSAHRIARPAWCVLVLLLPGACVDGGGSVNGLAGTWPEWQRIEVADPPSAWQVEEASFAFDAWEASAAVSRFEETPDATTLRFDDGEGNAVEVRLAALPSARFAPTLAEGDRVLVTLVRVQGFEGVAQGLTVTDESGRLLLLYDDGGYGPAYGDEAARAGLGVERALGGAGSGDRWASRDVTFRLDGDSVVLGEGQAARLGDAGLVVAVVVSREWTGQPMTDVDLAPLAYVVFRADGA